MYRHRTRHTDPRHGRRGQGLVEFALIVPVFLLFLLLAVDFGRLLFSYIQLSNTAREAAAYAAFNPTTDNATLTTVALREANVQAQRGQGAITATSSCTDTAGSALACSAAQGGAGAGNRIEVYVDETFTFFTPLINGFFGGAGLPIGTSASSAVVVYGANGGALPGTCAAVPPTPTFTWQSPNKIIKPLLISVDAGASAGQPYPCGNVGYNWDFGGASTTPGSDYLREGVTQDYEFALPGIYTVTLIVTNPAGSSVPVTQTINLGTTTCNNPTANFTVSPAAITKNGNITNWQAANNGGNGATMFTFDGSSSAYMSDPSCHPTWEWDLGDGTKYLPPTATSTPPAHGYPNSQSGHTVHVTLTVRNDSGNDSKTFDIPLS
jgi:Flp pilus assembly protein TadG/PKD repeat protein